MKSILLGVVLTASLAVGQTLTGQTLPLRKCMERASDIASGVPDSRGMTFKVYYSAGGECYVRLDESFPATSSSGFSTRTSIFDATDSAPALVASFLAAEPNKDSPFEVKRCEVVDELVIKQCHSRIEFEHLVDHGWAMGGKP